MVKRMAEFNRFIDFVGFFEPVLQEKCFTWFGSNNQRSRIDKIFVSKEWMISGFEAKVNCKGRFFSGLCYLVLLGNTMQNWGPKPFRFADNWLQVPGFLEMCKVEWSKGNFQGWAGYKLMQKMEIKRTFEDLGKRCVW